MKRCSSGDTHKWAIGVLFSFVSESAATSSPPRAKDKCRPCGRGQKLNLGKVQLYINDQRGRKETPAGFPAEGLVKDTKYVIVLLVESHLGELPEINFCTVLAILVFDWLLIVQKTE